MLAFLKAFFQAGKGYATLFYFLYFTKIESLTGDIFSLFRARIKSKSLMYSSAKHLLVLNWNIRCQLQR